MSSSTESAEIPSLLSLPTEILAEILVQSQRTVEVGARPNCPLEITVSHVSRQLRAFAVNTPQLWTNIQTRLHRKLIPL
ncbi:hypothetical protein C8R44DRAFT_775036 [Mycena epipterygia]|nr:hypothetical protein C8R44DRAFT_775036 [Mycena epipterygia]